MAFMLHFDQDTRNTTYNDTLARQQIANGDIH